MIYLPVAITMYVKIISVLSRRGGGGGYIIYHVIFGVEYGKYQPLYRERNRTKH